MIYAAPPSSASDPTPGALGSLIARTNPVTIAAGRAPGWVTLRFPAPVRLTAGFHWLGLHSGGSTAVGRYAATPTGFGGTLAFNPDAYGDGSGSTFGTTSSDSKSMSIYAVGGEGFGRA